MVLPEADVAAVLLLLLVMEVVMVWMVAVVAAVAVAAALLLLVVSVAARPAAHPDVADRKKEAAGFRAAEEPVTSEGPVTVSFAHG